MSLIGIKVPGASRCIHGTGYIIAANYAPPPINVLVLHRSLQLQAIPELVIGTTSERHVFMVPPTIHDHRGPGHRTAQSGGHPAKNLGTHGSRPHL